MFTRAPVREKVRHELELGGHSRQETSERVDGPLERSKQGGRGVGKNPGHHRHVVYVAQQFSPGPDCLLENILSRSQVCPCFWRRE